MHANLSLPYNIIYIEKDASYIYTYKVEIRMHHIYIHIK
jgi:hypothetical protein